MQKRYRIDNHPFTADMTCARTAVNGQDITCIKSARVTIKNVRRLSI